MVEKTVATLASQLHEYSSNGQGDDAHSGRVQVHICHDETGE